MLYILDEHGNIVSQSRNLRGIREAVGKRPVTAVHIMSGKHGRGILRIDFNGHWHMSEWASYEVLRDSLRRWRNLYGAPLWVDGFRAGKVGYWNEALAVG